MTSCLVSRSIASIRSTSKAPFSHMIRAASAGITPSAASASIACASISNQMRKRVSGAQIATISARE